MLPALMLTSAALAQYGSEYTVMPTMVKDIVVKGNIGHMSAFMAQTGNLVVFGDAGDALGDSIYEARLFVRGSVKSLGADCIEKPMTDHHLAKLARLLDAAGIDADPHQFRRYGSARKLYNFHIDHAGDF